VTRHWSAAFTLLQRKKPSRWQLDGIRDGTLEKATHDHDPLIAEHAHRARQPIASRWK
jgi:hypothetical protein